MSIIDELIKFVFLNTIAQIPNDAIKIIFVYLVTKAKPKNIPHKKRIFLFL